MNYNRIVYTIFFQLIALFSIGQNSSIKSDSIVLRKIFNNAYQPQIEQGISGIVFLEIKKAGEKVELKTLYSTYKDTWFEQKSNLQSILLNEKRLKDVEFHFIVPVYFDCIVNGRKNVYELSESDKVTIDLLFKDSKTTRIVLINSESKTKSSTILN